MINHPDNVLKLIHSDDRVLDVGGGLAPFSRADAVVDIEPYETYVAFSSEKNEQVNFNRDTWFVGDICYPQVWSQIPDKAFDFVLCSHTLEDVRDPLFVCSQLQRVAKAGYIETPSKFRECAKANGDDVIAGWEHHRWIIEVENEAIFFKLKNPFIHHFDYLGEARRPHVFDYYNQFVGVYWVGCFDYAERTHKGSAVETEDLFYFFDHYPYDKESNVELPPVFYTIDNSPFRGKTVYFGNDYSLPIENVYSIEMILQLHHDRMAREGKFPTALTS